MIPAMFIQVGGRLYPVATLAQASQMFCTARDIAGQGAKFVAMVEAGNALQPINHSTLAHNPDASILEVMRPRRAVKS